MSRRSPVSPASGPHDPTPRRNGLKVLEHGPSAIAPARLTNSPPPSERVRHTRNHRPSFTLIMNGRPRCRMLPPTSKPSIPSTACGRARGPRGINGTAPAGHRRSGIRENQHSRPLDRPQIVQGADPRCILLMTFPRRRPGAGVNQTYVRSPMGNRLAMANAARSFASKAIF
jgi:hypothetical protein